MDEVAKLMDVNALRVSSLDFFPVETVEVGEERSLFFLCFFGG